MVNTDTFKINVGGQERELSIRNPNGADYNEADIVKNRVFFEALQKGLPTLIELDKLLEKRGVWDADKEQQVQEINKEIADKEYQLTKGNMKLTKGKKIALEIKELRQQIQDLVAERVSFYNNSAEGTAQNMHFNCLVSRCLVYNNTNEPYFADLDAYVLNSSSDEAVWGANVLANTMYSLGREAEKHSIENEFLTQFNLVNENLQLVDANNNLIDEDGDRIDENGYKIDKDGNYKDVVGHLRDKNGRPIVKAKPFLDKDGNAIQVAKPIEDTENTEEADLPEVEK